MALYAVLEVVELRNVDGMPTRPSAIFMLTSASTCGRSVPWRRAIVHNTLSHYSADFSHHAIHSSCFRGAAHVSVNLAPPGATLSCRLL